MQAAVNLQGPGVVAVEADQQIIMEIGREMVRRAPDAMDRAFKARERDLAGAHELVAHRERPIGQPLHVKMADGAEIDVAPGIETDLVVKLLRQIVRREDQLSHICP